jgi:ferredoxin-type protein NapG
MTEIEKRVISRRNACIGLGATAVLAALGGVRIASAEELVRPPGGQDENHLIASCVRCEKCYEVCPQAVIKPAHLENGFVSMRTPIMNFDDNWCDWCEEANNGEPLCVSCCPTGALSLPSDAEAETTILGKAVLNTDWCLAYRLIGCRFCYDACPYEAIELDSENRPVVIPDKCCGCGACEAVCVSLENGSITVGATSRAIVVVPTSEVEEE